MNRLFKLFGRCFFICAVACVLWANSIYAEAPHLINYQGKLTDSEGTAVSDGTYEITFRIYDALSEGNFLWEEVQTVTVEKGLFNVLLGGVNDLDLPFDTGYWLGIKVGDDSEMAPRQRITSVGYAIRAETADTAVNATTADSAADADTVDGFDANSTPTADSILVADSQGKLPASALKSYDSGWFYLSTRQSATKVHNLGTTKLIVVLYFATDTNGSNMSIVHTEYSTGGGAVGTQICDVTLTTFSVRAGLRKVATVMKTDGGDIAYDNGYFRVVAIALE